MAAKYNPRKEHALKRKTNFRPVKETFLIVCEGLNTEPEYFNAFRLTSAKVKTVGEGLGTMSLVREAISLREVERRKGRVYNHCWVVFDKDDYADFDEAIAFAERNGFSVAYSNQAFEIWFLVHFGQYSAPLDRGRYGQLLEKHLGIPYSKKAGYVSKIFNRLRQSQEAAIENASMIEKSKSGTLPSQSESITTVHKLVESLEKFSD